MAQSEFQWMLSFAISFAVCVLILTIGKTVKIKFSRNKTRNTLTLKPYYALNLYLVSKIVQKSIYISFSFRNHTAVSNYTDQFGTLVT